MGALIMWAAKDLLAGLPQQRQQGLAEPDAVRTTIQSWRRNSAAVDAAEHAALCQDGYLYSGAEAYACPVCEAARRLASLRAQLIQVGVGRRYLDVTWDGLEPVAPIPRLREAASRIGELLEHGASLLLYGPPGGGKTQMAMLLARSAIEAGYSARIINLGEVAVEVRDAYSNAGSLSEKAALDQMAEPDLLVIDDLGAGETDNAKVERRLLYLATERRQNARRPCIVTSNANPAELTTLVGDRILNRLQPLTTIAVNHGKNFRVRKDGPRLW